MQNKIIIAAGIGAILATFLIRKLAQRKPAPQPAPVKRGHHLTTVFARAKGGATM